VASGRFEAELAAVLGKFKKRAGRPRARAAALDDALEHLPPGVAAEFEALHDLVQIADRLDDFLRALLALEAAIRGQISVTAAEETLAETLYVTEDDDYVRFVERLLAQARNRKRKS
jgi:hypothetical protein